MAEIKGKHVTIGVIVAILTIVVTTTLTLGRKDHLIQDTSDKVAVLEPEVKKNTESRIGMQKDIEHINKGIGNIEAMQKVILEKLP